MGPLFNCLALLGSSVRFDSLRFHFLYYHLDFTALKSIKMMYFICLVNILYILICSLKRFVALKVVKSAQQYTETALDEIKLLKCVSILIKEFDFVLK